MGLEPVEPGRKLGVESKALVATAASESDLAEFGLRVGMVALVSVDRSP